MSDSERPLSERPPARSTQPPSALGHAGIPAAPTPPSRKPKLGCFGIGVLVIVILAVLIIAVPQITTAIQQASQPSKWDMMAECIKRVASWADMDVSRVDGESVSDENSSGVAWDFRGTYPGGSWACGGAAGEAEPSVLTVRPNAGHSQNILDDSTPLATTKPGSAALTPEAELSELTNKSAQPSQNCLDAMSALANTSYDASDAEQNAAVARSTQSCATVGEYIRAYKLYPGAWGMADASFIDGSNALLTIRSACSVGESAPICIDATNHGLL